MKRSRKLIRARNVARRDPVLASLQREKVLERAMFRDVTGESPRCEFEKLETDCGPYYYRCLVRADETCHVLRRHKCGTALYDPDVAIAGCRWCHNIYDHRTHSSTWSWVRVPPEALDRAEACVRRYEAERDARGLAVVPLKGRTR